MNESYILRTEPLAGSVEELVPTRRSLLERLRDVDDQASWQEFFDLYWRLIYRAAIKSGLSESEAEEVVQETVLGVARRMESFRYEPEVCSFKGWLMHISQWRIIDLRRKRQTQSASLVPLPADTAGTDVGPDDIAPPAERPFEAVWDEEWHRSLLEAALAKVRAQVLPEHYQIFYLSAVQNLPMRDVQELLGVSRAKVYVVRHRLGKMVKREVARLAKGERVATLTGQGTA